MVDVERCLLKLLAQKAVLTPVPRPVDHLPPQFARRSSCGRIATGGPPCAQPHETQKIREIDKPLCLLAFRFTESFTRILFIEQFLQTHIHPVRQTETGDTVWNFNF